MSDLISRSAMLELYADTPEIKMDVYNVPIPVVRQNILDMPAVDAVEVVHGRWEFQKPDKYGNKRPYCSNCGGYPLMFWADYVRCNYCPQCGAQMDGGEDACRMWTNGRMIADESASRCPEYTELRESAAYQIGKLEAERNDDD